MDKDKNSDINKLASNVSLFYLHSRSSGKLEQFLDKYKIYFFQYKSYQFTKECILPQKNSLFLIELDDTNKEYLSFIQDLSSKYSKSHIYIFSKEYDRNTLLKFALNCGIKNVYSDNIDKNFFKKFIYRSLKRFLVDVHNLNLVKFGEDLNEAYPILIFSKHKINYINTQAKKFFKTDKVKNVEKLIYQNVELSSFISNKKSNYKTIFLENQNKEYMEYLCSIHNFQKNKTLLSILHRVDLVEDELSKLTQNRFVFLDSFKDKIVQNSSTNKDMYITIISIDNAKKLQKDFTRIKYYEFLKNFLKKIDASRIGSSDKIVEWSQNQFVLVYENINFEKIKQYTSLLHNNIIESQKNNKMMPIITTSFFSTRDKDLNAIIEFVDKIGDKNLTSSEAAEGQYYEYTYLNDDISEKEQIEQLLHNCLNNAIPTKLLNIYKGLCVNTDSKILKYSNGFFYLECAKLQRYVIKIDNETVIQSPVFPHDIRAVIKFIDLNKSYIMVEKFQFLKSSANSRKYTRVQPTVRIPVVMQKNKFVKYGELLDLSVKSIAIKFRQQVDKSLLGNNVDVSFKLPNKKSEDGFKRVEITAKILIVVQNESFTKVVIDLGEGETNTDILQYVYERQKDLVEELKKAIKVLK